MSIELETGRKLEGMGVVSTVEPERVDTGALRGMRAAATPGQWAKGAGWGDVGTDGDQYALIAVCQDRTPPTDANAALIVDAVNALPALLDDSDVLHERVRNFDGKPAAADDVDVLRADLVGELRDVGADGMADVVQGLRDEVERLRAGLAELQDDVRAERKTFGAIRAFYEAGSERNTMVTSPLPEGREGEKVAMRETDAQDHDPGVVLLWLHGHWCAVGRDGCITTHVYKPGHVCTWARLPA